MTDADGTERFSITSDRSAHERVIVRGHEGVAPRLLSRGSAVAANRFETKLDGGARFT